MKTYQLTFAQIERCAPLLPADPRIVYKDGVLTVPNDLTAAVDAIAAAADDERPRLIAHAHAVQWARAESGLTVSFAGGPAVRFPTDTVGRGLLNGAVTRAQQANPPSGFRWQTGPTSFVTLTPAQVISAGVAVADYIQQTFDTLENVIASIVSGAITSTSQIDAANWPAN